MIKVEEDSDAEEDQRPRQRRNRGSSPDEEGEEAGNIEGESMDVEPTPDEQLAKKLVRYAMACDFSRIPIRRDGIKDKGQSAGFMEGWRHESNTARSTRRPRKSISTSLQDCTRTTSGSMGHGIARATDEGEAFARREAKRSVPKVLLAGLSQEGEADVFLPI